MRAFLPTHPNCIYGKTFDKKDIFKLYNTHSTIHLEDIIIEELYTILIKGF